MTDIMGSSVASDSTCLVHCLGLAGEQDRERYASA